MPTAFVNPATQVDAHDSCSGWLKSISGDWLFLLMLVPDIGESRQGATPDNSPRRESGEGLANANSESLGDDRAFFGSCATMMRHRSELRRSRLRFGTSRIRNDTIGDSASAGTALVCGQHSLTCRRTMRVPSKRRTLPSLRPATNQNGVARAVVGSATHSFPLPFSPDSRRGLFSGVAPWARLLRSVRSRLCRRV